MYVRLALTSLCGPDGPETSGDLSVPASQILGFIGVPWLLCFFLRPPDSVHITLSYFNTRECFGGEVV